MLQVVLLILKIIGIILLVILGLLVLLVCLILFNAIKYEILGKYNGTLDSLSGKASFSWLFRLIRGEIVVKNGIFRWEIHIAWLKFVGPPEAAKTVEEEVEEEAEKVGKEVGEFVEEEAETIGEEMAEKPDEIKQELQKTEKKAESIAEETYHDITNTVNTVDREEDSEEQERKEDQETGTESGTFEGEETCPVNDEKDSAERRPGIIQIIRDFIKTGIDTIRGIWADLQAAVLAFLENIREQGETVGGFVGFFRNETHQEALKKLWDQFLYLLKKIRPRLKSLKLKFGFDDPSLTGDMLAGLAVLYPFLGDNARIYPDFENQVIKTNIDLYGKVRIWFLVLAAIRLLLDKNVRTTFTDVMSMMNP